MKTFKKFLAAALALTMLLALCACGDDNQQKDNTTQTDQTSPTSANSNGEIAYQVKVLDGQGNPITTGVVVKFLQNGKQVAMQVPDANGVATKKLAKGNYNVELSFTDSSIVGHYDETSAVLTAEKTSLKLTLTNGLGNDTTELVVGGDSFTAYMINAGSTHIPTVKANVRNYFVFTPAQGGTYEISVDNSAIKVGYYGSPFFVQELSAIDPIDNVITISISDSSLGGSFVLGLDGADADTSAQLSIIRTGDPTETISDKPWTTYNTTHTPAPYTLNLNGKSLKYIDIMGKTEDAKVIYNESDGYYHFGSANGPVVLVHLGKKAPYVSLQTVIEGDGLGGGAPIREYFFDKNGNFLKKEDYTDILRTYFENMDKSAGVYPLTKDLEYIIKNGCHGWWDKDDPDYIFTNCNPEIGWMFALCYAG